MSASDRLDIIDVINRLFIATDSRDWETVKQCFTDPVTIDMSSVGAGAAREMKPAEIAGMWETGLSRLKGIHHQARGVVINIRLDLRAIKLGQKEFKLPRSQPAQNGPA